MGSQVYAHRSRPSLLVQDIRIHNPTVSEVCVWGEEGGAAGRVCVCVSE